jgi:hypothetical protein
MNRPRPHLLPEDPEISADLLRRVKLDYARFARDGLPPELDRFLLETYQIDMAASYAGMPLRNPWGKASGQLTLNRAQVEEAAALGLGFVVLKTVIAQDSAGSRSMSAWAIKESQMSVERIRSATTGAYGWTVTWKGRGWWQSFAEYLDLVHQACKIGQTRGMLVVPSVKYHLLSPGESEWRTEEYESTTREIESAHESAGCAGPLAIEKDFSPTLAGTDRASRRATVIEWLKSVPGLIRAAAPGPERLRIGLKLFNSLDDDEFQLQMLLTLEEQGAGARPDFVVYANRLFDPDRVIDDTRGAAYGGPDLSDRNLRVLSAWRTARARGHSTASSLEVSGTGDIGSGRMAVEYALRGCTSFQIHTFFQLPAKAYRVRRGSRMERALIQLHFDPRDGFIFWLRHAANRLGLEQSGGLMRFLDLARRGTESPLTAADLGSGAQS